MGNSFLTYSAGDNNCQNFIMSQLESNVLANSRNISFTKQSTTGLFSPELRKLGAKLDIIREGGNLLY